MFLRIWIGVLANASGLLGAGSACAQDIVPTWQPSSPPEDAPATPRTDRDDPVLLPSPAAGPLMLAQPAPEDAFDTQRSAMFFEDPPFLVDAPPRFGDVTADPWADGAWPVYVSPDRLVRVSSWGAHACAGWMDPNPAFELGVQHPGRVRVSTETHLDTVLFVRLPSGEWICDDDGDLGLNARLDLSLWPDDAPAQVYLGFYQNLVMTGPISVWVVTERFR